MSEAARALVREQCPPEADAPLPVDVAQLLCNLTHELRQPLSTIESIAYYLGLRLSREDEKLRQQVAKLQQVALDMSAMLGDALHYLQASPVHLQLLDLYEIITETIAEGGIAFRNRFQLELSGRQALVKMDAAQARHMVEALLTFARTTCREGERSRVRSMAGGEERLLEVIIPGSALDSNQVASIFEPFCPHLPRGLGLGLASIQRIAQVHGGRAEAQLEPSGELKLIVVLPRG